MGVEIERKFLLKNDDWKKEVTETQVIRQGYLQSGMDDSHRSSVRIRISNDKANINVKSVELKAVRQEFEYEIPLADAEQMLSTLCGNQVVEKTRYLVPFCGHMWEIDIFEGLNKGLKIAEIELKSLEEVFKLPEWVGEEVSDDERYYNIYLLNTPFNMWR